MTTELFTQVNHLLTLANWGEDETAYDRLRQAQQQLARALEQSGQVQALTHPTTGATIRVTRYVKLEPRQLGLLDKRDFNCSTILRVRKYRIQFDGDGWKRRVWVWNPDSASGLADLPPSRIPKFIREFMQP